MARDKHLPDGNFETHVSVYRYRCHCFAIGRKSGLLKILIRFVSSTESDPPHRFVLRFFPSHGMHVIPFQKDPRSLRLTPLDPCHRVSSIHTVCFGTTVVAGTSAGVTRLVTGRWSASWPAAPLTSYSSALMVLWEG
jgi:hypothetical protein